VLQTLRVAPDDAGEKVVHPLEDDGMVAGEILKSQVRPLAAHGVKEHRGSEGSVGSSVLVVDSEEGCEAVGRILLQTGEWKVQLMDESVAELVAEDELITPHVEDVSCEVLLRDRLRLAFAGDDLRQEFGEDVVRSLRKSRRPKDCPTGHVCRRIVESLVG